MKKCYLLLVLFAYASILSAQTEVKLSPLPLLFGGVFASVEQGVSPLIGIDADLAFVDGYTAFNLSGKYYFNPEKGIDKFHIGAFIGINDSAPGVGFLLGYKWISRNNIIFELGLGLGRTFDDGVLGYGKLHIGYRFEKKSKKEVKNE